MTFKNPIPVVVGLIPVCCIDGEYGLLAIKRAIEPKIGMLALPGGYLEIEDWRVGLAREIKEEMGITIDPERFYVYDVVSGRQNEVLLIFARCKQILDETTLEPFVPNREVSERVILRQSTELAFPAHTQIANRFLQWLS